MSGLDSTDIVAPNFNTRFSGVTATVVALVPVQARNLSIRALGPGLPAFVPQLRFADLLSGWRKPGGKPARIWHARRNNEMIAGLLLRLAGQPWKLIFTSAALRNHSGLTRFLYRRMDAVIATSPQAASFLKVPASVITHGVDTDRFHPPADKQAAWPESGLPGKYGIGTFGRIRHQKGQDRFVRAMCKLLPDHPDATAVMIGKTTPDNVGFERSLRDMAREAGLEDRIVFLGELPPDDLPVWFRRLSLYIAPQRWEGFGLTPLEAMASGTPVVATRTGAAADLVREGETGWLVDADDDDALDNAIAAAMSDLPQLARMGGAGRAHVAANHSIETEANAIAEVYERVWTAAGG